MRHPRLTVPRRLTLLLLCVVALVAAPTLAEEEGTVRKTAEQLERGMGSLLGAMGKEIKKAGDHVRGSGKSEKKEQERKDDAPEDKKNDR